MITRFACVHTYVRPLPEVQRHGVASLLTSHVTKRGHTVVVLITRSEVEQQLQGHDRLNSRVQARMARQRRSRLGDYRTPLECRVQARMARQRRSRLVDYRTLLE